MLHCNIKSLIFFLINFLISNKFLLSFIVNKLKLACLAVTEFGRLTLPSPLDLYFFNIFVSSFKRKEVIFFYI
jgi:hypothetical protein